MPITSMGGVMGAVNGASTSASNMTTWRGTSAPATPATTTPDPSATAVPGTTSRNTDGSLTYQGQDGEYYNANGGLKYRWNNLSNAWEALDKLPHGPLQPVFTAVNAVKKPYDTAVKVINGVKGGVNAGANYYDQRNSLSNDAQKGAQQQLIDNQQQGSGFLGGGLNNIDQ